MRHQIALIILLIVSPGFLACAKKPRSAAPPVVAPPAPTRLEIAESYFENGDYRSAARAYEDHMVAQPQDSQQDRTLFRLALAYALPAAQPNNLPKGMSVLRRLVESFPKSPYRAAAELILAAYSEVEKLRVDVKDREEKVRKLTAELERLKKIDMERRPSRPPE